MSWIVEQNVLQIKKHHISHWTNLHCDDMMWKQKDTHARNMRMTSIRKVEANTISVLEKMIIGLILTVHECIIFTVCVYLLNVDIQESWSLLYLYLSKEHTYKTDTFMFLWPSQTSNHCKMYWFWCYHLRLLLFRLDEGVRNWLGLSRIDSWHPFSGSPSNYHELCSRLVNHPSWLVAM